MPARRVHGIGPHAAPVLILGEAPGRDEAAYGEPFVGEAGKLLDELLAGARLTRVDCRIENVVEERPPHNALDRIGVGIVRRWIDECHERLARCTPLVIVACGNLAWNAVRHGPDGIKANKKGEIVYRDKITTWRGSIVSVELRGRTVLVIPMLHPAFLLRVPSYGQRAEADWRRVKWLIERKGKLPPSPTHHTAQTINEVRDYRRELEEHPPPWITHDIETPGTIGCIGYASTRHASFTIPTTVAYWKSKRTMAAVWAEITAIERLPIPVITQNGFYDHYWLRRQAGIVTTRWRWDLLPMHHVLDPLEEHTLHHMASLFREHYCYWKDEAKDAESVRRYASSFDALCAYNGMDCTNQIAVFEEVYQRLGARAGAMAVYHTHYRTMLGPLLQVMLHGWRIDQRIRKRQFTRVVTNMYRLENEIESVVGHPLHAKVGLSNKKITDYLYQELGLRVPKGSRRNADAVALARLMAKYPRKLTEVVPRIIQHRRNAMLKKSYTEAKVDDDGRFRSSYNFAVKTGRLNSSKNPMGSGDNGQNTDRDARAMYLADEGCFHVELDLSQEEDRIVKGLTRSPRLIAMARRPPWEGDAHRETAAIIFAGVSEDDVTHKQRRIGKMTRHATNYDMEEVEFSNHLLKQGVVASPERCRVWIDRLRAAEPEIPAWHTAVRKKLLYDRKLVFSCGFAVDYRYQRLSKKLYKEAYAIEPQHGCVCHMNRHGLVPIHREIRRQGWRTRVNAHLHDALHLSVPHDEIVPVLRFMYHTLEREVDYHGVLIPKFVETKIGPSWGETWVEWKRLPATRALTREVDTMLGRMWEEKRWE